MWSIHGINFRQNGAASSVYTKLWRFKLFFDHSESLNTERSYKRQGHAPLKHFVGFPVQWWKAGVTVA